MRVVVVGAGVIRSVYAAALARDRAVLRRVVAAVHEGFVAVDARGVDV